MTSFLQILKQRARIIQEIRRFFIREGFLEVETPSLVESPGMEPHLNAFKTRYIPEFSSHHPTRELFLPTSPEFHMKQLLSRGCDKIFQICRAWRNGEAGHFHQPEFTILEWYRTNESYFTLMTDLETLFVSVIEQVPGNRFIKSNPRNIDYSPPWTRITVQDAWLKFAGIDLVRNYSASRLFHEGQRTGVKNCKPGDSLETIYYTIFLERIEPFLGKDKPLFLYEYPSDMAALARLKPDNPAVAMRFELYIDGIELGNAFDEVTDPVVQVSRCEDARALQEALGKEPFPVDEDFINALKKGIPPSCGIAMGVDRLIMLLLNQKTIEDVVAFPFKTG